MKKSKFVTIALAAAVFAAMAVSPRSQAHADDPNAAYQQGQAAGQRAGQQAAVNDNQQNNSGSQQSGGGCCGGSGGG